MKKNKFSLFVVPLLVLSIACASVGTGDPLVVRAEDLLSNSRVVYDAAMAFHFAQSTTETPQVYAAFEAFRSKFPSAWDALDKAKRGYQANKLAGTASLDAAVAAITSLLESVAPLVPVKKAAEITYSLTECYAGGF